jgi:uncharacterized protein
VGDGAEGFAEEWAAWHDALERRRRSPSGYLAVTGLHWLSDEPRRFDDAPGTWWANARGVHVTLDEGGSAILDGSSVVADVVDLGTLDPERPRWLRAGPVEVEVARRGSRHMIRPRRADAPVLRAYVATPCFAPSVRWAAEGHFIAHDAPRAVTVASSVEGFDPDFVSVGVVDFALEGRALRLTAFEDEPGELYLLFADATSGVTTYGGGRQLSAPGPDARGRVTLDFNRAINLPCAYSAFTTCPLPPLENRLAVAVEAGERLPASR